MTYVFPLWCSLLPFIHFSLKSVCIPLPHISQAFPDDCVLLWGLMQGKCESSKRSLRALSGMRDGLLSFTLPCCKSHLVACKPALCKCLDQSGEKKACVRIGFSNRRDWCCSHPGQPPSPAGESLPGSPHCFLVPLRAWLSYPQHLPCQEKVLGWAPCFPPLGPAAWWGGSCESSWQRKVSADAAGPGLKTWVLQRRKQAAVLNWEKSTCWVSSSLCQHQRELGLWFRWAYYFLRLFY